MLLAFQAETPLDHLVPLTGLAMLISLILLEFLSEVIDNAKKSQDQGET
jgi:hypothetical protein